MVSFFVCVCVHVFCASFKKRSVPGTFSMMKVSCMMEKRLDTIEGVSGKGAILDFSFLKTLNGLF